MRRWIVCFLALGAVGCSSKAASPGKDLGVLEPLFKGIRLGDSRSHVVAQARGMGIEVECYPDDVYFSFCPGALEPPPDRPDFSFSFSNVGRLTTLGRDFAHVREKIPLTQIRAAYRDGFGEPILDAPLNSSLYMIVWANADSSVMGMVTCPSHLGESSCNVSLEESTPDHVAAVVAPMREEMGEP